VVSKQKRKEWVAAAAAAAAAAAEGRSREGRKDRVRCSFVAAVKATFK
jgi:hypothetical protein